MPSIKTIRKNFEKSQFRQRVEKLLKTKGQNMLGVFIDIYGVKPCGDNYPIWFFNSESMAKQSAIGMGWYGGNAPITKHKAILASDGDYYILANESPIEINVGPTEIAERKEAALNKLTKKERILLGLESD